VDQNLNNSPNDFLWSLLENPANDANANVYQLHRLVNDFPQSGILQALLAHASEEKNLKRASAYFNPRALFKLINAPSTFTGVPDERIIIQPGISISGYDRQSDATVYQENHNGFTNGQLVADQNAPQVDAGEEHITHPSVDDLLVDPNAETYLSHVPAETTEIEALTTEFSAQEIEPPAENVVSPVEELNAGEAIHHAAYEPSETDEPAGESVQPHDGYEFTPAPDAIIEEHAPAVAEPFAEAGPGETELHSHPAATETEAHELLPSPGFTHEELPHRAELELPEQDTAHADLEATAETHHPAENIETEADHIGHELPHDTVAEHTGHEAASFDETEAPMQTNRLDDNKDELLPVIDIEEEQHGVPVAEIPVQEEIRPEPVIELDEAPVQQLATPISEDFGEVYDEIVGIEDINLGDKGGRHFTFDQEFGAHESTDEKQNAAASVDAAEPVDVEQQDVSKYYDEKMPYTFMWWLDKTRKEHAQLYQPYVKPPAAPAKKVKKITDELQQQYFENIFHITSVEELDKSVPPPPAAPDVKKKEQLIIERFIKEEPQIKPQSSDKLDNENKAKKSSEDRDELVSETLAAIYSDQMLYHKAIASYKKLMLKFPEKSRYFADKIEQLEKKTN